jgi:excisionase family DNA binding protein
LSRQNCIYLDTTAVHVLLFGQMEKLYTINEASALLRISRSKLYVLMNQGDIRPIKIGGKVLFPDSVLSAYIERLKQEASEE